MEVKITKYDRNHYSVTINDSVILQTTFVDACREDSIATDWVTEVRKAYGGKKKSNKKKAQNLAVGLFPEHSLNYKNGNYLYPRSTAKNGRYEVLQVCIGNHCLIYVPPFYSYDGTFCKALRDFLTDNNVFVFGIGIELTAKKFENDFGVKISNPYDLRRLVEFSMELKAGQCDKYKLEELGMMIGLGKEMKLVKPDRILWYESGQVIERYLSDEKIMYGSVDAFLIHEIGLKFLEDGTLEAFSLSGNLQRN